MFSLVSASGGFTTRIRVGIMFGFSTDFGVVLQLGTSLDSEYECASVTVLDYTGLACCLLHAGFCLGLHFGLAVEAACFCETLVDFHQTI
jgi:hypothetical protein